jgi:hypothetical protein
VKLMPITPSSRSQLSLVARLPMNIICNDNTRIRASTLFVTCRVYDTVLLI